MIMEIRAGDILRGRYEIQRLLRPAPDKGVYLAHDRVLDRPVVVDVFSNDSIMPNGLTVSAWEARVLGKLDDHPNIATAQDYWEEGETAVMVSRYLSGGTLLDRIAGSRESGTACRPRRSSGLRQKSPAGSSTSTDAASCTATCNLATCSSMSGARSISWTSIPRYHSTTGR